MSMIELIVGPRFKFTRTDMENSDNPMHFPGLRGGHGPTTVIDWMPISGPIVRKRDDLADPEGGTLWYAVCLLCGQDSKMYKRKNEPALFRWATQHRCPPTDWVYIGYGKDWTALVAQEMEDGQ